MKGKGEKERYSHFGYICNHSTFWNVEFQRIGRRDKKVFLSDQCKEIEGKNRTERLKISSRKLETPREHFMQRWAH